MALNALQLFGMVGGFPSNASTSTGGYTDYDMFGTEYTDNDYFEIVPFAEPVPDATSFLDAIRREFNATTSLQPIVNAGGLTYGVSPHGTSDSLAATVQVSGGSDAGNRTPDSKKSNYRVRFRVFATTMANTETYGDLLYVEGNAWGTLRWQGGVCIGLQPESKTFEEVRGTQPNAKLRFYCEVTFSAICIEELV